MCVISVSDNSCLCVCKAKTFKIFWYVNYFQIRLKIGSCNKLWQHNGVCICFIYCFNLRLFSFACIFQKIVTNIVTNTLRLQSFQNMPKTTAYSEQRYSSKVAYLRFSSTLILTSYRDLQTGWSPGSWRAACACPGSSSPDQPAAHSCSSICRWSPGARLRGVRHCSNDRWFIWVNLPLWLEKRGGGGDKGKDGGRNGADDPPPHFHSQSCRLQITRKWLHLMNVISVHAGQ